MKVVYGFLLCFACVSVITAYRHNNDVLESFAPEPELRALPALNWDGICPKKAASCPTSFLGRPPLVMVSLDGFHPDYLNRGVTPTLSKLSQCGVKARFMYPVFPSKTFPNHFSQVTGLNPASHGIIDNSMYDNEEKKLFKVGRPESLESFWWQREPIWVTARKQGKVSAAYFWPGSDVVINGSTPNYSKKYEPKATFEERVDQVLAWLDLPTATRPNIINMYVNQPDNAAHWFGVKSSQVNDALRKVDRMIERLYTGLQQRNLINCVNVVIVSDHGMSDIDCKDVVDIQKYTDVSNLYVTAGPFGRVRPRGNQKENRTLINSIVSSLRCRSDKMRVYPKDQLPVRMHYADNKRIEPIFIDMDSGWTVVSKPITPGDEICTGGAHGYDNMFPDMRGIFIAQGPAFKRNYSFRPFISTELYEMLAELIRIHPNPNNGTRGSLHHIMTSPQALPSQAEPYPPAMGQVPSDEKEYKFRLSASNCSCSLNHRQADERSVESRRALHLPFGVPYSPEDNATLRLLYNKDYVTAFDLKYRIPLWTAFTLGGKTNATNDEVICFKGDARIPINDAANCGDYNSTKVKRRYLLPRPLFAPSFANPASKEEASFVTNAVPKSVNHTRILETPLNQILAKWTSESKELNVVMGPAFDLHATGIRPSTDRLVRLRDRNGPLVVPTHIFVVATWCSIKGKLLSECAPAKLDAHGFLLPNDPYPNNCEPASKVIAKNVARVVDIQKLTGLSFYTGLPVYEAIRLRTIMPERSI